jgi:gamma-glutamyltranspeptidase/glutathione hydrolase
MSLKLPCFTALLSAAILSADSPSGVAGAGRPAVLGRNGMVATSQTLACQAGLRVLQQGGNAVDAAVATAAVLSVVEPMSTGPGGDMFAMVYWAKTGDLVGLNGSGFSPKAADIKFFRDRKLGTIPLKGAFSVTVPGAVDGWAALLSKYGTMSLSQVLAPAIEYAEKGFPVSPIIAEDWRRSSERNPNSPDLFRTYMPGGRPPAAGDVFVNPDLAWTLRQVAEGGRDAFYTGEIAHRIVRHLNSLGWPLTMEDMAYQYSDWVEPIRTTYKGYEVFELPPNGQGMAALEMLNILEGFDLKKMSRNSTAYLHHLIEAKKLAYADLHQWLADPDHAKLPVPRIISKAYAEQQRKRIDANRAAKQVRSGISDPATSRAGSGDTVYLTVVDKDRNAVSFINSLYLYFGSGVVVPGTGIALQDRGALFSLDPEHPNRLEGRKRPFHTIIPAMVYRDGKPWLSFGLMGGDMQAQGHVQVLLNMIEFGMNPQQAGDAPRFHHNLEDSLSLEPGIDAATAAELAKLGHDVRSGSGGFGGYQAIQIDWERGVLIGGTDPRKDGQVAAW